MGTREPLTLPAASGAYYAPLDTGKAGIWRPGLSLLAVAGVHVLLAVVLAYAAVRPETEHAARPLAVRLLEVAAPSPPRAEPAKPLPPQQSPKKKTTQPPVLAAAAPVSAAPDFPVKSPSPPLVGASTQPPAPVPATVTEARFDADYLHNPKPKYPMMSRRLNEEGMVLLRVRVSVDGNPLAVEVKESSGFPRLDQAARETVERWRFVPARRGAEAIEAAVLVPLNFTLSN